MRLLGKPFPSLFPLPSTLLQSGGAAPPANTAVPTITGTAQVGETLIYHAGTWTGTPTLTLTWEADGTPISGETGTTLVLTADEAAAAITVTEHDSVSGTSATSDPTTGAIPAAPTMATPVDAADVTALSTSISETLAALGATSVRWELAAVDDFSTVLEQASDTSTNHSFSTATLQKYWMRAVAINAAGEAPALAVTCFLTTTFAQSYGSELVTDGAFANWSGDDPAFFTITGQSGSDPEVTERAANALHAGSGTGAANLFATAGASLVVTQAIGMQSGHWYEGGLKIGARASGNVGVRPAGANGTASISRVLDSDIAVATYRKAILNRGGADGNKIQIESSTGARDLTVDDLTVKEITVDAPRVGLADGTFDFGLTVPATPLRNELYYAIFNRKDEDDFWVIRLLYTGSAYNMNLYSVEAGVMTSRTNQANVGAVTDLRIVKNGASRQVYVKVAGVWNISGAESTYSVHDSETGIAVVCNSGFTPGVVRIDPNFT